MTKPAADKIDHDLLPARRALLAAALPHVSFDGWSQSLLTLAASEINYDVATVARICPGGAIDLLRFWLSETDRIMIERLTALPLSEMRIRDRITAGVRIRLEILTSHREAVRRSMATLTLPQNAAMGLQSVWRSADAIWWAAGDTATDHNWYTKRMLLAGVYSATLLYWLDDASADNAATWMFLDRRINDVLKLPQHIKKIRDKTRMATALPWSPARFSRLWRKTFTEL